MRLEWKEIRSRAATFAADWKHAHYEKGETQSFYNAFFQIFGVERRRVAVYEHSVEKLGGNQGFIDLFWPGTLIVEQKSKGRDLFKAEQQALDYTHRLKDAEMPRFILVCDFQTFKLTDLDSGEQTAFALQDLPKHVEKFGFILGRQTRRFKDQDPVNIKAAELVGALHDEIKAAGYTGHKLEVFLTRIVFCLFADDTGIFEPKDIFWDWLESLPPGSDVGARIGRLFEVLNTPEVERQSTLDADLARFPYINGHLFEEYIPAPSFNDSMTAALLNACRFDWTPISPAIFGSLFQSVMDPKERRAKGAHYTTEKNIMKVIEPLFLDDLREEFERLKALRTGRRQRLEVFHEKLGRLTFFDPACGCGNFLIIAYRELRLLEIELLKELRDNRQQELDVQMISRIDVDQFYGIEFEEFPARIAETALWMMDHIMNTRLSLEFGQVFVRIPLQKSPHILHADALEVDWEDLLPPERCSYVLGNPPFIGAKYQSTEQRAQVRRIADLGKSGGTLDYVCAWFIKAGEYAVGSTRIGFVSTNSITQGEQVAQLWPVLFDRCKLEIGFAHRTFAWGSDARGKAHVHVVILGLDLSSNIRAETRLFTYSKVDGEPDETRHRSLSPYLFDSGRLNDQHLVVREESRPINGMPRIVSGCQPIDNGNYVLSLEEKQDFLQLEPNAVGLIRPYYSGKDYIEGESRFVLALQNMSPQQARKLPEVRRRIEAVRKFRSESLRAATRALADYPTKFNVEILPTEPFLAVPEVSSERRDYIPIGWLEPPSIPSNKLRILENAKYTEFAILTSAAHVTWSRYIGGRLKSDFSYGIGLNYNTFPLPPKADLSKLEPYAQAILDARANHPGATLADLYDPDLMPPDLRKAHRDNDRAVDRLYRRSGFDSDRERVEHLFALYEQMVKPLLAKKPKRKRRSSKST